MNTAAPTTQTHGSVYQTVLVVVVVVLEVVVLVVAGFSCAKSTTWINIKIIARKKRLLNTVIFFIMKAFSLKNKKLCHVKDEE